MRIEKIMATVGLASSLLLTTAAPALALITTDSLGLNYATSIGLGSADVRSTISKIIGVFLGLLGIIAVVIVLMGGFTWMTAGGNEEKVTKAKDMIIAGVIGLAIILAAYAIAGFAIQSLVTATTTA